ncbi:hypothetical protein GH714_004761 [Hevea brasiliensis]|uniref:NB-ARC domain-containing protein n=1 Tax=Hevea brasiliensis TaxID=3981 RepID=A0A6A6NBU4_HEVBR|nr:hypothetical protein GH714_004761 [Hevea brasiliensis]
MDVIKILSGIVQFLWQKGHIKHQEQNIEQLKLKIRFLYYMRDALKEEIMKELVRGRMPSREYRTWLHKGEKIEHQINDMLDAQLKDSVIDVQFSVEQSKQWVSMLEYEIVKCLERSPFDHGPSSDPPHETMRMSTSRIERKMYRSMKKGQKVKSLKTQARAEKKATRKFKLAKFGSAVSKAIAKPFPKKGQIYLVQKVEGNKATAEAYIQEIKSEITGVPSSPSSLSIEEKKTDSISVMKGNTLTAEAEPKEVIYETMVEPISPSSASIEAAKIDLASREKGNKETAEVEQEVEDEITIVPTSSISSMEAAKADLAPGVKGNMAVAGVKPKEVEDEITIVPTSPSIPSMEAAKADLGLRAGGNMAAAVPVRVRDVITSAKPEMVPALIKEHDNFPTADGGEIRIKHMVQKIHGFITNTNAKIIGIYGQGGIGKTSILKVLIDDPKVKDMFHTIIWVTVSRCWSTKIQDEVVRKLEIGEADFGPDSDMAKILFRTLEKKKFLLILDDVWEKIDLHAVGIPSSSLGKGCRLILATRSLEVCHDMADKEIEVGGLSSKEAWELFRKQAGQIVDSPNIQPYARGIVNECGKLPLNIIVTARALTGENNVSVWKHALKDFLLAKTGNSDFDPQIQQMKFSYERLKVHASKTDVLMSCDIQSCFLYCALLPEDYEVNTFRLVDYWIREGLIAGNSADARKKGHDIVRVLIDAALLESTKRALA